MASPFSGKDGRLQAMWLAQNAQNTANQATSALTGGYNQARTDINAAKDEYLPLKDLFGRGANLYADVLGVNGAEGLARGQQAFQASPGYNFARDEALQAALRGASAGGSLASGGTLTALQNRASNLALSDFGNWRQALGGYNPLYSGAVDSSAGTGIKLADLGYGYGRDTAGILTDSGKQINDIAASGFQAGDKAAQNKLNFGMQLGSTLANIGLGSLGKGGAFAPGGRFA